MLRSIVVLVAGFAALAGPPALSKDEPGPARKISAEEAKMDPEMGGRIDALVKASIDRGDMSGCVVLIGRKAGIAFEKAYGNRQVEPQPESMTTDTLFDMASLTKPLATATSVMILVQRGQIRLSDKVAKFFPDFAANDKGDVTVENLLTHSSGLIPDNPIGDYDDGWMSAEKHICNLKLLTPPGSTFRYSDVNFILLGKIVEKVSGKPENEFVKEEIYDRLGMRETGYNPPDELKKRAETTEKRDDKWIKGEVHDPRAYALKGVAGHAGLFSTAEDLAIYGQMMLQKGRRRGVQILSEATFEEMIRPRDIGGQRRALGWDNHSGYSRNRGELMSDRAFGHGGFTGTSMWIDPDLNLFVIFLGDRLHPDGKGEVNDLAGRISSIACGALLDLPVEREARALRSLVKAPPLNSLTKPVEKNDATKSPKDDKPGETQKTDTSPAPSATEKKHEGSTGDEEPADEKTQKDARDQKDDKPRKQKDEKAEKEEQPQEEPKAVGEVKGMRLGIDMLAADEFKLLKKKRVGLITNQTGLDSTGVTTIDRLKNAPGVTLVSLFSPEHGIRGVLDHDGIPDSVDEKTGLPIYSLYGKRRWPTKAQLEDIDVLVFDVQDVGARFYTNTATMALSMKAAAEAGKEFIVLDRPDPIGGTIVEGPLLDGVKESFVGIHNIPIRYGLTIGELAKMYAKERNLKVKLTVVKMEGWQRDSYLFDTGMTWTNPSPNMRSMRAAALYTGVGVIEYTNISVGRGTNTPFELLGAPWINERDLAFEVNAAKPLGVKVLPVRFTPTDSKFKGQECHGLSVFITDLKEFKPFEFGLVIMHSLHKLYPTSWEPQRMLKLLGSKKIYQQVVDGDDVPTILKAVEKDVDEFRARKKEFEIYK
jgi:uncharacterized protein YbbC (DUF1343 family)/CubicO group peptidase (beta-lactamase class C family)